MTYGALLLCITSPLLAWATARRLGAPDRVGLAAALVPFAIPQLTHVGASVNNDNLFVALCAVLAVPLASVLRGDRRPRTALVVGVVAGLALLTKGLGVVLPVWIACCYAVPVIRQRRELAPAMKAAALAVFTTVGVGGWFTFRNLVVHGTPSPSIHAVTTAPDNFSPDLIAWLKEFPVHLTKGFWGYFGYYEVQIGTWATIGATVVTVGIGTIEGGRVPASGTLGRMFGDMVWNNQPVSSRLEEESLRRIAEASGGEYLRMDAAEASAVAERALAVRKRVPSATKGVTERAVSSARELYQIPLFLAALLLLSDLCIAALPAGWSPRPRSTLWRRR